jgi:hypothetical protein
MKACRVAEEGKGKSKGKGNDSTAQQQQQQHTAHTESTARISGGWWGLAMVY